MSLCYISMIKLFDNIIRMDMTERCWFTSLTCIFSAALQTAQETRYACSTGSTLLALQGQGRLDGILPVMLAISQYWPRAEAIYNVFHSQASQLKEQVKASQPPAAICDLEEWRTSGTDQNISCEDVQPPLVQDYHIIHNEDWAELFGIMGNDYVEGNEAPDSYDWLRSLSENLEA